MATGEMATGEMTTWDPAQYAAFGDERSRPGVDLIARIPPIAPGRVVDLGCGRGDLAVDLAQRWPAAHVTGMDLSPAMLADAQARFPKSRFPQIDWVVGDIDAWTPDAPVDLLFSNAALHWLGDHAGLFPRLMDHVAPGGVLAVQMPNNFAAASHTVLQALVADKPWAGRIPTTAPSVLSADAYWRLLRPAAATIDIWETSYQHVLTGDDPVLNWVRGTTLRPILSSLRGEEADAFQAAYGAALRDAYPPEPTGETLFAFRRLFIVARKAE